MKKMFLLAIACMLLTVPSLAEDTGEERTLAAQNDRLSLYVYGDLCRIDIEDALTGRTWSSTMNDPTAGGMKIIPAQQKRITSLLTVNCLPCF